MNVHIIIYDNNYMNVHNLILYSFLYRSLYIYIYIYSYVNLSNDVYTYAVSTGFLPILMGSLPLMCVAPQQKPAEGNIKNLYPKDAEFAGAAPGWHLGNLVCQEDELRFD